MKKKLIIGITGSIAAFKSVQLISDLSKENYEIDVLMTPSAAKFVTPLSIQALTKRKVYIDVFDDDPGTITHVDIVKNADAFIVVPASATTMAKLAYGIADNMLTAAFLAATCPKLIAPAMNVHMYENNATQRNIDTLKNDGVLFIEPGTGLLACGDVGKGKLADYNSIKLMIEYALHSHPLKGKRVLISAGPTRESMDPVRFISNHSTGKMGYAIARAAFLLGADVTLAHGPVSLEDIPGVTMKPFVSANDLFELMKEESKKADYIIMSAAVGDYRPQNIAKEKIKKNDDCLHVELIKNPDILSYLCANRTNQQIICGFAMETNDLIAHAKEKLLRKNADMIVANSLRTKGAGFATDTNVATLITKENTEDLPMMSKEDLGLVILDHLMSLKED